MNRSPTNPWFGKCLKNVLPHHSGCFREVARLGVLAHGVVHVLVHGDAVVQRDIEERQRDVVLDIEGTVFPGVGAPTRQLQTVGVGLVTEIQYRVVDRVQADHALVHVRPGVIHAVIVEPEEALLLRLVTTRRPVQIQVVTPLAGLRTQRSYGPCNME